MNKKLILAGSALAAVLLFSSCAKPIPAEIYSADGSLMATLSSATYGEAVYDDSGYRDYTDIAVSEAAEIIAQRKMMKREEAVEALENEKYVIETVFDKDVFESMKAAEITSTDNLTAAVTDNSGKLLAVYTVKEKIYEHTNTATENHYPGSALKPLSVYAPALERGIITWSSAFEDSPVKKIVLANGKESDWPTNADGKYTGEDMLISEAIKRSVNTVAVKTLKRNGVGRSISFLSDNFGMDLSYEKKLNDAGEGEEILANIGLGYLAAGVDAVDMAGYYQIFATGGKYVKPYTVSKITDPEGTVIYEAEPEAVAVISEETAFIMNKLLQTVVGRGGTGADAYVSGIALGGKTGTAETENGTDNWFVGFTPEYTCSVWHSAVHSSNRAASYFALLTKDFSRVENSSFLNKATVESVMLCSESGMRAGDSCTEREIGYFVSGTHPKKCEGH